MQHERNINSCNDLLQENGHFPYVFSLHILLWHHYMNSLTTGTSIQTA